MAQVLHAPKAHRPSLSTGWIVLFAGSAVAFVLGAIAQILVFLGLGLCTEARAMSDGDGAGRTLMIVSILLGIAITVAVGLLWWR